MNTRIKRAVILVCLTAFAIGIWGYSSTPSLSEVKRLSLGSDRVLKDRKGRVVQVLRTDFSKRKLPWLELSNFPETLQKLLILSEDKRFYFHPGIDPISLARVFIRMLGGSSAQGASTITMQVVDLINPEVLVRHRPIPKGSWKNKLSQLFKSVFLQAKWSKLQILETYMNEIHLKGEFQGFATMSYAYFNKSPVALSDAEMALMVSLVSSPNQSRERLKRKSCHLINQLKETNCDSLDPALETIYSVPPKIPQGPSEAMHLGRRLFAVDKSRESLRSTIDGELQLRISEILARHLDGLKLKNVHDAAAIVIDNETGEVLAYLGNSTGYDTASQVDGVVAFRQAGSTLKPFIYARAFGTKTMTPASILLDEPTAITWNGGVYRPTNYDHQFNGPVSAREALASSLNVPAVKLVTIIGLIETYKLMQDIGLQKLQDSDFYGVSMALGAVDVQLEALANAYRMLANGGVWKPLRYLMEEDARSDSNSTNQERRVFDEGSAFLVKSILSDPSARAIGFGFDSPLETPFWTAVKTGTSKDYRDNWCVGFSSKYTVGVWAGNFDSSQMMEVSGVTGAGPMWGEIMGLLHSSRPSAPPLMPADVVQASVQFQWSTNPMKEYFLVGTAPASGKIEPAVEKRVQIVFPAESSVLVKNPHLARERQALFIRFKGLVPVGSQLLLNDKVLGVAVSPFKVEDPPRGNHKLSILSGVDKKVLASIHFVIK